MPLMHSTVRGPGKSSPKALAGPKIVTVGKSEDVLERSATYSVGIGAAVMVGYSSKKGFDSGGGESEGVGMYSEVSMLEGSDV